MKKIEIDRCQDLTELAEYLNGLERDASLDETRVAERVDLTRLPTYGGEQPRDTIGVYSWDVDSLLYYDGPAHRPWVISPREK